MSLRIQELFDPTTWTLTYLVSDPATRDAVVIDSILDYDPASGRTSTGSLERLSHEIETQGLRLHYALETHPHADHLSGAQWLKRRHGAKVAIGERVKEVQAKFSAVFDRADMAVDGSQFDRLLADGERVEAGSLVVHVLATPGHTPACSTYRIGDALFTGDVLFIEDYGTGRCDFPAGSAEAMYESVHDKLYALPASTRVFPGHDYLPNGRPLRFETSIGASKETNVHLRASTTKDEFVRLRRARDQTLAAPRLLYPSVQVNVDGGRLPPPHANGVRYLVVPVNLGNPTDDAGIRNP